MILSESKNVHNSILTGLAWGTSFIFVMVISVPLNGFLISRIWGWFIVPITSTRNISIWQGIGLAFCISFAGSLANSHMPKAKDNDKNMSIASGLGYAAGVGLIYPVIALGFGWLLHTATIMWG